MADDRIYSYIQIQTQYLEVVSQGWVERVIILHLCGYATAWMLLCRGTPQAPFQLAAYRDPQSLQVSLGSRAAPQELFLHKGRISHLSMLNFMRMLLDCFSDILTFLSKVLYMLNPQEDYMILHHWHDLPLIICQARSATALKMQYRLYQEKLKFTPRNTRVLEFCFLAHVKPCCSWYWDWGRSHCQPAQWIPWTLCYQEQHLGS